MRLRLDSSLHDDAGWTTPSTRAQLLLLGKPSGAQLRDAADRVLRAWDQPLEALAWLDQERRRGGRWTGFLSYELGRLLEPALGTPRHAAEHEIPLFVWGFHTGAAHGSPPHPAAGHRATTTGADPTSSFTRSEYLAAVARCLDYIVAGDVLQVNLSQRLELRFHGDASSLYAALLESAPAAYGALLELDDLAIVSNSPELFLRVTADRRIITRPIKGTRPNGPGLELNACELRDSPKDEAELNMIIDLERNDLGRVCQTGTVGVTRTRVIERHPTVFHGVAEIQGQLRDDVGLVELLRATFPGGSVTGAPKIRAMQIIDELEPDARGVYCGAIGHLDADGSLQLNLAIRTMTLDKRTGALYIPVGGGIVAESDPAAEYEETWVKARAGLAAAQQVRI